MTIQADWIRYGADQEYLGYLAVPERVKGPVPAVIVLQEIWGVDDHIQHVARRFAEAGYVALSPDLYAKNGERPEALSGERIVKVKHFLETVPPSAWNNPEERDRAMDALPEPERTEVRTTFATLFGGLDPTRYIPQLKASSQYLRAEQPLSKGAKVGSVGFCMGGALSAVLATEDPELAAAAIFYGNAPAKEKISSIQCPVYGFYASLDPRITDQVPEFAKQMQEAGKSFQYKVYEGAHHAFFNDTRASYHIDAARDSFATVLQFFAEHLR
ncbi:dienelactone hydrolase family protein [Alicyclobacillus tolerans]|uniref:Carboxymethylenebutenolidase n=1 Tax=Alicyclobacillus tolerans TaxID=90970 RepID=A0ABT9LWG5_9BACL|nr:dienelactone hydrolase family protein [Alicyclobacillus tengchongensis]MDP9728618.1 carboxymethylenebutenolidase [Alicyclobacillus tengchongensis]